MLLLCWSCQTLDVNASSAADEGEDDFVKKMADKLDGKLRLQVYVVNLTKCCSGIATFSL